MRRAPLFAMAVRQGRPAPDPAELLRQVIAALHAGEALRPESARWLLRGLQAFAMRGGDLAAALGLRAARGDWTGAPHRRHALEARNRTLRALILATPGSSTWERCERAADYLADRGPAYGDAPLFRRELERGGHRIPTTAKQLHSIFVGRRNARDYGNDFANSTQCQLTTED